MIEFHRYKLRFVNGRSRSGFILRVGAGYSDLMVWPELGEPSEADVLEQLKGQRPVSPVVERAIDAAIAEADAFESGRSLLSEPIENHSLLLNLNTADGLLGMVAYDVKALRAQGFRAVKIKVDLSDVGRAVHSFFQLQKWTGDELRYRLDFNCGATLSNLSRFLGDLPLRVLNCIDFVEDPMPFELESWRALSKQFGIALALDRPLADLESDQLEDLKRSVDEQVVQALVVKPSYDVEHIKNIFALGSHAARDSKPPRSVVTSNLGHPLGYLHAASIAEQLGLAAEIHGCQSAFALSPSDPAFNQFKTAFQMKHLTPWLSPSPYPGCGFPRAELERLSFQSSALKLPQNVASQK